MRQHIEPLLKGWDLTENLLPVGQDIALAIDLAAPYKNLNRLVFALQEAIHGHLLQVKTMNPFGPD